MKQFAQTLNLLRALFVVFTAVIGSQVAYSFELHAVIGIAAGTAFGLLVVLADRMLKGFTLQMFSSATFGLLLGFLAARLLLASGLLARTPETQQWLIGLSVYSISGYLGMMLALRSNRDEFALIIPYVRFRAEKTPDTPILVDSNIIIDGRLKDIAGTGFLTGSYVVPRFVLEELQLLADSHDTVKREKGRLALARLQEMQRDEGLSLSISEHSVEPFSAVDSRLVQLARILGARILTNDGNLCAIARLQGIVALNLNDLSKAMRVSLTAGDEVEVLLSKEGRDQHQAVGYLADGTMIIVNHSRALIGKTVRVGISTVLQTSAGRLYFAELRQPLEKE